MGASLRAGMGLVALLMLFKGQNCSLGISPLLDLQSVRVKSFDVGSLLTLSRSLDLHGRARNGRGPAGEIKAMPILIVEGYQIF